METVNQKITIIVNQRPFKVENPTISAEEIKQKVQAPDDYEVWKVTNNPDPEGQLPVDDIQITDSVAVKSGDRFRVVPPGTFGLTSDIPAHLAQEIETLKQEGFKVTGFKSEGFFNLVFEDYPLPPGYNKSKTKLLLKAPLSYPNGNLDMFWVNPDLRLEGGGSPASTSEETALGEKWLRFSWHPKKWHPVKDNVKTFLEFVNRRLGQLK